MKKHEAKGLYEAIEKWLKDNRNKLIQDISSKIKESGDMISIGGENDTMQVYLNIKKKK